MNKFLSRIIRSNPIGRIFNLGDKQVAWKKITELKPGIRIAIQAKGSDLGLGERSDPLAAAAGVIFDEIVSIRKVGRQQVWDIEVEGTHNFIGNGIVAHNTTGILMRAGAATLEASNLGTSSTTADIQLYAADSMLASVGDLTLQVSEDSTYPLILRSAQGGIQLSTQSADNGNLILYSAGTLTLDSSRNNTNIILSPGTGNVGIGTTSPSALLHVNGATGSELRLSHNGQVGDIELTTTSTGGILLLRDSATNADIVLDARGTNNSYINNGGNVGIGTTSPGGIFDVLGAGAGVLLRAGSASLQLSSSATSTTADIELAAADQMDLFAGRFSLTTSSSTAGDLKLISTGTLSLSTSSNNTGINVMTGTGALTETIGSLSTTASASNLNAILLQASSGGIQLSTGSVGLGSLRLLSSGSLTLETSERNTNIALLPGTGGVALGVSTPAGSATLDISSTSKGFLPPRMTTTQRDNISSPAKGLVIFNDTTNQMNVYTGSAWAVVGDGPSGVCNSSYDCRITLSAEYPGAVISADGSNNVGTITSDLTLSASNYYYNYYEFTSGQASQQDYDVYIRWQLPLGWADWDDAANAIEIDLATESSTSTDSKVDASIYRENDADSYSETANVSPTGGEWRTIQESKSVLSITKTNLNTIATWSAGDIMVVKLKLYSKDNYYSRIGNIRITYENQ